MSTTLNGHDAKIIYWRRELPPADAELLAEHTVEASSPRVRWTLEQRDELWRQSYAQLMAVAETRLGQEVARLGGHYAHVRAESVDEHHDDLTGEAWLHGRFSYLLYRRPPASDRGHPAA